LDGFSITLAGFDLANGSSGRFSNPRASGGKWFSGVLVCSALAIWGVSPAGLNCWPGVAGKDEFGLSTVGVLLFCVGRISRVRLVPGSRVRFGFVKVKFCSGSPVFSGSTGNSCLAGFSTGLAGVVADWLDSAG
jgi:hypothetical protein